MPLARQCKRKRPDKVFAKGGGVRVEAKQGKVKLKSEHVPLIAPKVTVDVISHTL